MKYVIGIDQSTQGTKVLLFDETGKIVKRVDRSHGQLIDENGYVSHDMEEIYGNLIAGVKELLAETKVQSTELAAVGISNQRETTVAWDEKGTPYAPAVVWQCHRATEIAERHSSYGEMIRRHTGLPLSPFFPAAKMQWLLEHVLGETSLKREEQLPKKASLDKKEEFFRSGIHLGTVDSFLVYRLTGGKTFATDYSNASRTQLFDLHTLSWNPDICRIFGIDIQMLPEVKDSNGIFGYTDFEGILERKIPIHSVLGDSHAALYGQGCHKKGMIKATYGTGSSIMLHTGDTPVAGDHGLAVSLAWGMDGAVSYVLEGNINYAGAVISWLKNDVGLMQDTGDLDTLVEKANKKDTAVVVPAFTGLSAPYWKNNAKAAIMGMTRTTGKPELVKAAIESIAHQIADVIEAMELDCGEKIQELRTDGGPTQNAYLMQFQSDMAQAEVLISKTEELSAIGAAYMAGIAAGCMEKETVFSNVEYHRNTPAMQQEERERFRHNWKEAVHAVCSVRI